MEPNFKVYEIQADDCKEVAAFSVKYACEKLGKACEKSDTGLYIEALGGLPDPYNAYFCNQIGKEKFLDLLKNEKNRNAILENVFAYCEPGCESIIFSGRQKGKISYKLKGNVGAWHDMFFIPEGEKNIK